MVLLLIFVLITFTFSAEKKSNPHNNFLHKNFLPTIKAIENLVKKCGKPKWKVESPDHSNVKKKIAKALETNLRKAFKETDVLKGSDPYSLSKSCSDMIGECINNKIIDDMKIATIRCGNFIGGGDWSEYRIIPLYVT